ncbi:MAG: phosphatase PAP2 family protein [Rubrivivax sp.]
MLPQRSRRPLLAPALVTAVTALAAGCASAPTPPVTAADVGELKLGSITLLKGYLTREEYPDSLALLPPPPAEGSAALAADGEAFRTLTALQKGPRGAQATRDAELRFPAAAGAFSCALGAKVDERGTPHLYMLLRRTLTDSALATYKAKDHYQRTRPFVVFNTGTCTPASEPALRKDGSYPSGHSAIGWAWAEVLAQVAPERADALLQRGRSFSQSRGVCGAHWKSDIEAGRLIGAAAVARMQASPVYQAQLAAARDEVAKARAAGQVPAAGDCQAEADALATSVQLAP